MEGIGSVYSHPDLVRLIIEGHLRPLYLGRDPCDVEKLWELGYALTRWYGRKGAAISALGGLDTALWDIRGKVAGKPIHELLGSQRHSVPVYASALLWQDDPSSLAEEARRHLAAGFRAMKMRIGKGLEYDLAAVKVVRDAIGPDIKLMVDAGSRYSLAIAQRVASTLQAQNVFWFEEPLRPEDVAGYVALRPQSGVSLAAGENEFGVQGFRDFIQNDAVDIVQPDCSRSGGITECRRIGLLAVDHGLRVATHTWSDAVALVANMHLIASLDTGIFVESDQTGNPFITDLLAEPLEMTDGKVTLPPGPGLGIKLNQEALDRLSLPPGSMLPEGNYSDMVFGTRFFGPAKPYEA